MLTTQMALNLLAVNDFDGARTQIKKTHEREAVIADLRDKEYLKREEDAEKQGVKTEYKDLKGYPVASLDAPEVVSLKKTVTRARSAITWPASSMKPWVKKDLAAPGYRKAAELRPNTPLLEQALLNLDKPATKNDDSDILIVVQSGLAPSRDSIRIPLPLPISGNVVITPLSFPLIKPDTSTATFSQIGVDGRQLDLTQLNSTTAMSLPRPARRHAGHHPAHHRARRHPWRGAKADQRHQSLGRPGRRPHLGRTRRCRYPNLAHPARLHPGGAPAPEERRAPGHLAKLGGRLGGQGHRRPALSGHQPAGGG
nr:hypothetical protein GCM10020185_36360 [Pseudomonas brassicacearum subsp. brassicacearum]